MKRIAIITARGGSKRVPRKNIKNFCGKPIIYYSIMAALESHIFDEIMVSTDDKEIAEIAIKYGAKVPFFRTERTSDDMASTLDVIVEVINMYKKMGVEFDECCCIYPTAPFITDNRIIESFKKLGTADIVIPVTKFSFPPQRGLIINNGRLEPVEPESIKKRSQDLPLIYHDCGQFYTFNIERILEKRKLYTDNIVPLEIPEMEVQDIDTIEDWEIAELKFQYLQNKI